MYILAFLALLTALWRELWSLFRQEEYRSVLLWMGILLGTGVTFYSVVEGWSVIDSLYFCVITLATIGFGDLTPTTPVSKLFTVAYVLLGLSFFVGFASLLASERRRRFEDRQKARTEESSSA